MFGKLQKLATEKASEFIEKTASEQIEQRFGSNSTDKAGLGENVENVENAAMVSPIAESATRKALFVGINYFGTSSELKGCIHDVQTISKWLFTKGFSAEESMILTDDQTDTPDKLPTKENILNAMRWLVKDAKAGDSLFFEYSGHGGTAKDADQDEEDMQDETICPMDYSSAGQILDDEMNSIMVHSLPEGCHLTCIYDSCHSGSALDLPFTYTIDGNLQVHVRDNAKAIIQAAVKAGVSFMKGDKKAAMQSLQEGFNLAKAGGLGSLLGKSKSEDQTKEELAAAREKMLREKGTQADVVQLAGCMDAQTSADACIDGAHQGAMSYAFMQAVNENPSMSYTDLLKSLRETLAGKYSQIPQMSTGKITNMGSPFAI